LGGSAGDFLYDTAAARRSAAETRLSDLLERYGPRGGGYVAGAPVAKLVLSAAPQPEPGLIAGGSPRHPGLVPRPRRSRADEVAASAHASVLVVPHHAHLAVP